jgi:hypothetical protein
VAFYNFFNRGGTGFIYFLFDRHAYFRTYYIRCSVTGVFLIAIDITFGQRNGLMKAQ